jgi:3-deoxy-7-phosphoheptulonate synthase
VSQALLAAPGAPVAQQPDWAGPVAEIRRELAWLPGLVRAEECADLRSLLGAVARREAVVVQAGDCAERFAEADRATTLAKVAQLRELGAELRDRTGLDTVAIGRLAGQYAKPRSSPWEERPGGGLIPSYRGDAINDPEPHRRTANPRRLLVSYDCSASILDAVRSTWPAARVYASHEALLLDYEVPLIRSGATGPYASSGHLVWVGDRTRDPHGPHIELAAAVVNPVAVKLGPSATPDQAVMLARRLNPEGIEGRLTFIVRMGVAHIADRLPPIVAAVGSHGPPVAWLSDPMHGNTVRTAAGHKTRAVATIKDEVQRFVSILRAHRAWPGGLHLEATPDDVTECVQGAADVSAARLPRYRTACDPRLDPAQAREVVTWFAAQM